MKPVILAFVLGVVSVSGESCINVLTFNAALRPDVKDYEIRREKIPLAVDAVETDFICLQEVWQERDVGNIIEKLEKNYKYHYSAIHYDIGQLKCPENNRKLDQCTKPAACSESDARYFKETLIPCATKEGCMEFLSVSSASALQCIATKCKEELRNYEFSMECVSCAYFTSPSNTLSLDACTGTGGNRFNKYGLLILSSLNFTRPIFNPLFPGRRLINPHAYMLTWIREITASITCTQLSAIDVPFFEYAHKEYTSFEEVQKEEIDILILAPALNIALAGNLNTGPKATNPDPEKNLTGKAVLNYEKLVTAKFKTAYLTKDGRCTLCSSNPLAKVNSNSFTDEILVKGQCMKIKSIKRVLDNEVLSDHYGVDATVCKDYTLAKKW